MKLLREVFLRLHAAGQRLLGGRRANPKAVLKVTVPKPLSGAAMAPVTQNNLAHRFTSGSPELSPPKPLPCAASIDDRRHAA